METKTISYTGTFDCLLLHCNKCQRAVHTNHGFDKVCGLFNEYLKEITVDNKREFKRLDKCLALPVKG